MGKYLLFGFAASLAAFLVGAETARHDLFPWPQLAALKMRLGGTDKAALSRYRFDGYGLLISDETKTAVACPKQSDRTAVLLALGQSNAANHGGQRYASEYGARVVNYFAGKCFVAASPLLGSDNAKGEYWTQVGNLLMASGAFDNVVIAPLALSGSEVGQWARGGVLNGLLAETARQIQRQGYRVTDVLWDQGESDYFKGVSADAYRERFLSVVETLRQQDVTAPVYVSVASKCLEPSNGGFKVDASDNPIVRAQRALAESGHGLKPGVNTDDLLAAVDRYDDCHMGGSGAAKVSRAWADLLLANREKVPPTAAQNP